MAQVHIVTLLGGRILVGHAIKKQSGDFAATRPSREERLRREPVSSLLREITEQKKKGRLEWW